MQDIPTVNQEKNKSRQDSIISILFDLFVIETLFEQGYKRRTLLRKAQILNLAWIVYKRGTYGTNKF